MPKKVAPVMNDTYTSSPRAESLSVILLPVSYDLRSKKGAGKKSGRNAEEGNQEREEKEKEGDKEKEQEQQKEKEKREKR